jgi:hypothetical protein
LALEAHKKLVLEYVSASQVEAFIDCPRKWFNKSVLKLPEVFSPAAARGSRVHKGGEIYLATGKPGAVPPEDLGILDALISALPKPDTSRYLVEHKFTIDTYPGGPKWTGYIDLVDPAHTRDTILVQDQKTRSDLRYAKKPADLLKDTQMLSYGEYIFETYPVDYVLLKHVYVCTKANGRGKNKYHKVLPVEVIATRNHVAEEWLRILVTVRQMADYFVRHAAGTLLYKDMPANTVSCEKYGGCSFKEKCFGPHMSLSFIGKKVAEQAQIQSSKPKETNMPTLAEKLAAKAAAKAGTTPPPPVPVKAATPPPKPATPPAPAPVKTEAPPKMGLAAKLAAKNAANGAPANGTPLPAKTTPKAALTPPDAPPETRNTAPLPDVPEPAGSEEGDDEDEAPPAPKEKKLKASKKKGPSSALLDAASDDDEVVPPPEEPAEDVIEATIGPTVRPDNLALPTGEVEAAPDTGFVLYIDSIPLKGDQGYVMFEDFFRPISEALASSFGVADYRVIDFGKWRAPLANLFRIAVNEGTVPAVLIVSSYAPGVNEALDVLVPFARRVVKSLRG